MTWTRVYTELARSRDYPAGSDRRGYEFILPLDAAGRLDRATYDRAPELCTVRRFWEDGDDSEGEIVHRGDDRWVFSYVTGEEDDEPIAGFAERVFREGEYLSVRQASGAEQTLRIVLVEPAPGLAHTTPR